MSPASSPAGSPAPWVDDANAALLTDLYQLTMLQAYWAEGTADTEATFSLYFRRLPPGRNYMVACGLDDALRYLERLRFGPDALEYLAGLEQLRPDFLEWLGGLRFQGAVQALREGTPVFPYEPLLEVTAPMAQAQLVETFVMNQVHLQTVLASKAARVVEAAAGRPVVDFGLRRTHGTDAGLKSARAFHVAGVAATSNVLAGRTYGLPVTGTMAHSYVQAHDDEAEAFRAFTRLYPRTVLLVDTYDTLEGVRRVVELARELGDAFQVRALRLDSGDLGELARASRRILDEAGLERVELFASGGLGEEAVADLLGGGAPIDGFGVGTHMGVSRDAPDVDLAYKLVQFAGQGRLKTSSGKKILPGPKQVFRLEEGGRSARDTVARRGERLPGRPLLEPVMEGGRRLAAGARTLDEAREHAARERDLLPDRIRALAPAAPPYPVTLSPDLEAHERTVRERVTRAL